MTGTSTDTCPGMQERRKLSLGIVWSLGGLMLPGCGGGSGSAAEPAATSAPAAVSGPVPAPPAPSPTPAPPAPTVGSVFTSLSLRSTSAGTYPYSATVLPLRGQLPAGRTLQSPDDANLEASILSTHGDGSAAVVVVSGSTTVEANATSSLRLQAGAAAATAPLTAAAISALVSSVRVDLGRYGTIDFAAFGFPERIWWANARTICARYRSPAPAAGTTALEAVVDIQVWAGRALVEVVVENASLSGLEPPNAAAASSYFGRMVTKPDAASYTGATVAINGTLLTTVSGNGAPEAAHVFSRAWYAAGWVGGDPGLRVVQSVSDLQAHPLFFRCDQRGGDMSAYAGDTYAPWSAGRHRASGMGSGGDHASIGPLPLWEAHFLQTGDHRAAKAVEANALAILGYNINYRDHGTGLVPSASQLVKRTQTSSERNLPGDGADAMGWEAAHQPAAGLMAFTVRPSPVFIELAQKIAVWNATRMGQSTNLNGWWGADALADNNTGVFGFGPYQTRGFAWSLRALAHATFLSPDGSSWKAGGRYWINRNRVYLDAWRSNPKALLNIGWEEGPDGSYFDHNGSGAGFATAMWMWEYLITEVHKAAAAKLLSSTEQAALDTTADWAALQSVRWVNEQPNGGWRFIPYKVAFGRDAATIDSLPDWGQQMSWYYLDSPDARTGPWRNAETQYYAQAGIDNAAGAYYPSYFWSALVAAVERNLPGASGAWSSVNAGITNLSIWRNGFAADPRWGSTPRIN